MQGKLSKINTWMAVDFERPDNTTMKTDYKQTAWVGGHFSNHGERSPFLHTLMHVETLPSKEDTIYKPDEEMSSPFLCLRFFKMDRVKAENCPVVSKVRMWHSFWKSWTPPGYIEGWSSLSACSSMSESIVFCRCISADSMDNLHIVKASLLLNNKMYSFWRNLCCWVDNVFFKDCLC